MTDGEQIKEYQKLNSEDQRAYRRFLWRNLIVGAISLAALVVVAAKFSGEHSDGMIAQNASMRVHAEAK
jgi:hypothetical protein